MAEIRLVLLYLLYFTLVVHYIFSFIVKTFQWNDFSLLLTLHDAKALVFSLSCKKNQLFYKVAIT